MRTNRWAFFLAVFALLMSFDPSSCAPIRLKSRTIEPGSKSVLRTQMSPVSHPGYYILQFAGPVDDGWKRSLEGLGIRLLDSIPDYAFLVRLKPGDLERVSSLDYVDWIEPLTPADKIDPAISRKGGGYRNVVIRLFPGSSPDATIKRVRSLGGKVIKNGGIVRAVVADKALDALSRIDEVEWIEEWHQPRLSNNVAQGLTGVPDMRRQLALYGEGQTIAFADTGLDTGDGPGMSSDFSGRIVQAYALRRPGDWSDLGGHGTHVIGTAVGSGALSGSSPASHSYNGSFAGVAPEAGVIIQSIGDDTALVYPPLDLDALFQPAFDGGARVHSDSWGTGDKGAYTYYSEQVDRFVWTHQDCVIVFSAGNYGVDANADGFVDAGSVNAPGTAKNCITVGATESLRSTGRVATYGQAWPDDFPANPITDDLISDNPQGMAAWSGRGPCADGRIKPDICAPGTNIISSRSHACDTSGWQDYNSDYIYWGGTSMSTPMVAGAAALAREHYIKDYGFQPSAALVKATLLCGAKDLAPGQYGMSSPAEIPDRPNGVEGWGRLDLASSLGPDAPRVVQFVDDSAGLSTGGTREYTYTVTEGSSPLTAALVWTDPPAAPQSARDLVNNLNLQVVDPQGASYLGNDHLDNTNNVESVDIPLAMPGTYTVRISGANVPTGPQPFALVVSGSLTGSYVTGHVRTSSGKPVQGAVVTAVSGATVRSTTTQAEGGYTLHLEPGAYTVTAARAGWTFDPPARAVTVSASGVKGIDFTGSAPSGSVQGTVTRAAGGLVNYVLESAHPYQDLCDVTYTISARPDASRIRVHFSEISVQQGYDFLEVQDALGNTVNQYTGSISDRWSDWVSGNSLVIHLITDAGISDYGFYVDGYETDLALQGGLAGVAVRLQPGGAGAVTQADGSYAVGGLEPVCYAVVPEADGWTFSPSFASADVPPGGQKAGVDFLAFAPGSISGTVLTGSTQETPCVVQSRHPYPANVLLTYPVQGPANAAKLRVHFTSIQTEPGFDFVYVTDADDNIIDTFTGTYSDQWSSWVEGNSLKIVLETDKSVNYYGFQTDISSAVVDVRGVAGVDVTLEPGGVKRTTGTSGSFLFGPVKSGRYTLSASRPFWSFEPASMGVNVVPGELTPSQSFFGLAGAMPGVSYIKTLADGESVILSGMLVTAGNDQLGGCFYVEDQDLSSGIGVSWNTSTVRQGDTVDITGSLVTSGGERVIQAQSVKLR